MVDVAASTSARSRSVRAPERELQVYTPHRLSLPMPKTYLRDLWRRRSFAVELSRTELRAQHANTIFGAFWLVINPVLLAGVYFVLVTILRSEARGGEFLAHLMAGLFAFGIVSGSITTGAKSVTKSGKLILNTAFPRVLLPLAAVRSSFVRFLPTMVVYLVVHLVVGLELGLVTLWALLPLLQIVVFAAGLAMLVSAAQVYFRDLASFLPYVNRIWLYMSPVLYYATEVPEKLDGLLNANPLFPMLAAWSTALSQQRVPAQGDLLQGTAWAVGCFVLGALFFTSREREFAVRL